MSIAELATVVNSNFNKPLNEQARELKFSGSYLLTSSTTFTPEKSGWYKVIVVGSGGEPNVKQSGINYYATTGGSGGVAISTLFLVSSKSYPVEVTKLQSSFDGTIIALAGSDANDFEIGYGGTATGGDFNYSGNKGKSESHASTSFYINGTDVGVYIPELMRETFASDGEVSSGLGILGYGSASAYGGSAATNGKGGCVLIIPLEFN